MSIALSVPAFKSSTVNSVKTDYNLVALTAGVEYSQVLPANCKGYSLKPKTTCEIKISHVLNGTNVSPITIPPTCIFFEDNFFASTTLYFQTSVGSVILELSVYS